MNITELNEIKTDIFKSRISELTAIYGGIRAAGRALGIDPAYLTRLSSGEKQNPGRAILRKLGL